MTAARKGFLSLVLLALPFSGCGSANKGGIDYSQSENWLSLPAEGGAPALCGHLTQRALYWLFPTHRLR